MRFGLALDLWHKGEEFGGIDDEPQQDTEKSSDLIHPDQAVIITDLAQEKGVNLDDIKIWAGIKNIKDMPADKYAECIKKLREKNNAKS
jgi:hypothetical protein